MSFKLSLLALLVAGSILPKCCSKGPRIEQNVAKSVHEHGNDTEEARVASGTGTEATGDPTDEDHLLFPRNPGLLDCFKPGTSMRKSVNVNEASRAFTTSSNRQSNRFGGGFFGPAKHEATMSDGKTPYDPAILLACMMKAVKKSLSSFPAIAKLAAGPISKIACKVAGIFSRKSQKVGSELSALPRKSVKKVGELSEKGALKVGEFVKDTSQEAAKVVGKGAKEVGGFVEGTSKEAAKGVVKGAKEVGGFVEGTSKEAAKGVVQAGGHIKDASQDAAKGVAKGATKAASVSKKGAKKFGRFVTGKKLVNEPTKPETKASVDPNIMRAFVKAATPCFELFDRREDGTLVLGTGYAAAAEVVKLQPIGAVVLKATEAVVESVYVTRNGKGEPKYNVDSPRLAAGLGMAVLEATKFAHVARVARVATTFIRRDY